MKAYVVELVEQQLAFLLVDTGDDQSVYSGLPESIERIARDLDIPFAHLRGREREDVETEMVVRHWYRVSGQQTEKCLRDLACLVDEPTSIR